MEKNLKVTDVLLGKEKQQNEEIFVSNVLGEKIKTWKQRLEAILSRKGTGDGQKIKLTTLASLT
jgi:hypothetical protein